MVNLIVTIKLLQLIVYKSINCYCNYVYALSISPITPLFVSYPAHCIASHWNQFFPSSPISTFLLTCLPAYPPVSWFKKATNFPQLRLPVKLFAAIYSMTANHTISSNLINKSIFLFARQQRKAANSEFEPLDHQKGLFLLLFLSLTHAGQQHIIIIAKQTLFGKLYLHTL